MKPVVTLLAAASCLALATALALAAEPTASADASRAAPVENPVTPGVEPLAKPAQAPIYGPILAKDPLVRAEIKRLYQEVFNVKETTLASLKELNARYAAETDPDFRFEIAMKIRDAKAGLERRNLELNLQIARLNGDAARTAELENALDRLLHPEKYAAPYQPDRAVEQQRLREAIRK